MNQLQIIEQKFVDFQASKIMAIKANNGKIYAGVSWICHGMGLTKGQTDNQVKKINSDPVLKQGASKMTLDTNGIINEISIIEINYLPLWLAKINASIIQDSAVQQNVITYQLKAKDVLAQAFLNQPKSQLEIMQMTINQMIVQEKQIQEIKQENTVLKHRIDNLDAIDTIGDLQQRLNKMVKRYAWANGIDIGTGWKHFDQAFNTAYRTNITSKRNNYAESHGLKSLSRPQYLSFVNQLEDAIRVVDKMLNLSTHTG